MQTTTPFPEFMRIHQPVLESIQNQKPVVALESTVLTHGLPFPNNIDLAMELLHIVRENGAFPAIIGILKGQIIIGMSEVEIKELIAQTNLKKVSTKDISICRMMKFSGGTTVSATMALAYQAGIRVFSTGGIGGVHKGEHHDISNDLHQLSKTPMIVVCSGPKAILDIPATREYLETIGVPVVGYKTDQIPSFYHKKSDCLVEIKITTTKEIAALARIHWQNIDKTAVLVTVPPPIEISIPRLELEMKIKTLVEKAENNKMKGGDITPYILRGLDRLTAGESVAVNIQLLKENARISAKIAVELERTPEN